MSYLNVPTHSTYSIITSSNYIFSKIHVNIQAINYLKLLMGYLKLLGRNLK